MSIANQPNFVVNLIRSRAGRRVFALPLHLRRRWLAAQSATTDKLLADLSAMLVGEVTLQVAQFDAKYSIDPRSHLFMRVAKDRSYEPDLWAIMLKYIDKDRDFLDIGANIGFFSVGVAKRLDKGRVLSVEPMPEVYDRLSRNVAGNGLSDKVILFNGALSDREGEAHIQYIPGMEEYSSLGDVRHPAVSGKTALTVTVPTRKLDDLVAQHGLSPALMKIDVEGAEALVFSGAQHLLREFKPVILSELSNALLKPMGSSVQEIVGQLRGAGYRVIDPTNPSIEPGSQDFGEILCLPESMS